MMGQKEINSIFNAICSQKKESNNPGLLSGSSGRILSLLYAAQLTGNKKYRSKADALLNELPDEIRRCEMVSHCSGLAGIGWFYQHINSQSFIEGNMNLMLKDFDQYLPIAMEQYLAVEKIDFLHEASGLVLYFYSRKDDMLNAPIVLEKYAEAMEKLSIQENNQLRWNNILYPQSKRKGSNISLSHGMSAFAVLFSKMYNINNKNAVILNKLITGTIDYILSQRLPIGEYNSIFPPLSLDSDYGICSSRLAWCYGDLGIGMALYQAGKTLHRQDWIDKAISVLVYAAEKRRDLSQNGVLDACFCHGTSGIAHIFYRMWWNTRLPEFKRAADYWISQTLKMARFEDGLAGYKTWQGTEQGYLCSTGLLEGIAGIGLTLLSYYYETEPTWDECLLLS